MYRKFIAGTIIIALLLTGCGKEKAGEVTGYGAEGTTASAKNPTENESETGGSTATDNTSSEVPSHSGRYLSSQLGGKRLDHEESFNIGSLAAKTDIHCGITETEEELDEWRKNGVCCFSDSEDLPAWSVREIKENMIYEDEIVSALLKDAAPVKRYISSDDAESTRDICIDYAGVYEDGDFGNPTQTISTWIDAEDHFVHTYEGKYLDTDYQLVIGYRESWKCKTIVLGPKNWGDISGNPDNDFIHVASDHKVDLPEKDNNGEILDYNETDLDEVMQDPVNRCTLTEDKAKNIIKDFTDSLKLRLDPDSINADVSKSEVPMRELLFVNSKKVDNTDINGIYRYFSMTEGAVNDGILNGFAGRLSTAIGGQGINTMEADYLRANYGQFYLNDKGVVYCNLFIYFDFEERLSDQVAILPFEKAMAAFQENIVSEIDVSKVNGNDLKFTGALLEYFPVESPDKPGEYTFIPVWVTEMVTNGNYYLGQAVQNAVDGSIITVQFNE